MWYKKNKKQLQNFFNENDFIKFYFNFFFTHQHNYSYFFPYFSNILDLFQLSEKKLIIFKRNKEYTWDHLFNNKNLILKTNLFEHWINMSIPIYILLKNNIKEKFNIYYKKYITGFRGFNFNYFFLWKLISYSNYLFWIKYTKREKLYKLYKNSSFLSLFLHWCVTLKEVKKIYYNNFFYFKYQDVLMSLIVTMYPLFNYKNILLSNKNRTKTKKNWYFDYNIFNKLKIFIGQSKKSWLGKAIAYCSFDFAPQNKMVINLSYTLFNLKKSLLFLILSAKQGTNFYIFYELGSKFKDWWKDLDFLKTTQHSYILNWVGGSITNIKKIYKKKYIKKNIKNSVLDFSFLTYSFFSLIKKKINLKYYYIFFKKYKSKKIINSLKTYFFRKVQKFFKFIFYVFLLYFKNKKKVQKINLYNYLLKKYKLIYKNILLYKILFLLYNKLYYFYNLKSFKIYNKNILNNKTIQGKKRQSKLFLIKGNLNKLNILQKKKIRNRYRVSF